MMRLTNTLLGLIVILLCANLYQSTQISKQLEQASLASSSNEKINRTQAKEWGEKAIALYNSQKHHALYELFHPSAKIQISESELATQLKKLFQLFGRVDGIALSDTLKLGEKGGETYYQYVYRAKVSNPAHQQARLSLSMIKGDDHKFWLYGFKLNARHSLN